MLEIKDLTCAFGAKRAVDGVSLRVDRGAFLGVIGRSGAGKSTLLRSINRLQPSASGSISWNGRRVDALKGAELRAWRARCAMVFQQFNLVGRLDVMTNVLVGRLNGMGAARGALGLWSREDRAQAICALEQFDIVSLAAQRAEQLSGGQQQRVAIARAFVQNPDVILADEPIASLDPRNTKVVMDALLRLNKHFGITILCNLHDLDVAKAYCGRLIGMAQGRIVFDGAPDSLTEDVARDLYGLEGHAAPILPAPLAEGLFAPAAA
jgi:phosphonate transport system ATP-binding protein